MILLFGPAGAGKSTQGEYLNSRQNWRWLSTGQLFRQSDDPELHKILKSGELVSDDITQRVVAQAVTAATDEGVTQVVLDGFPRNTNQASWLGTFLSEHGQSLDLVLSIEVPEQEFIRRLEERGRMEDTKEAIRRRSEIYKQTIEPVLQLLEESGVPVAPINGVGTVEEVSARIDEALSTCQL